MPRGKVKAFTREVATANVEKGTGHIGLQQNISRSSCVWRTRLVTTNTAYETVLRDPKRRQPPEDAAFLVTFCNRSVLVPEYQSLVPLSVLGQF